MSTPFREDNAPPEPHGDLAAELLSTTWGREVLGWDENCQDMFIHMVRRYAHDGFSRIDAAYRAFIEIGAEAVAQDGATRSGPPNAHGPGDGPPPDHYFPCDQDNTPPEFVTADEARATHPPSIVDCIYAHGRHHTDERGEAFWPVDSFIDLLGLCSTCMCTLPAGGLTS